MLEILELKRSYWNKYKNRNFINSDVEITNKIQEVFNQNMKQYGYRRITKELNQNGVVINYKKVLRIMNENGIRAQYVRKMHHTMRIKRGIMTTINFFPDLIKKKFSNVKKEYSVLYTDVTYHIWNNQRFYQSTIIDGFTKQIIDFKISKFNDQKLIVDNLNAAIFNLKSKIAKLDGIIIHSDYGTLYATNIYKKICENNGLVTSAGKGCFKNIIIEWFHSLLKKGTIHNNFYKSIDEYYDDVIEWNNWYINKKTTSYKNL